MLTPRSATPGSIDKPSGTTPRSSRTLDIYSRARANDLNAIARRRASKIRKSEFGGARLAELSEDQADPSAARVHIAAFEKVAGTVSPISGSSPGLTNDPGNVVMATTISPILRTARNVVVGSQGSSSRSLANASPRPPPSSPVAARTAGQQASPAAAARTAGQQASLQMYASTLNPITRKAGSSGGWNSRPLRRVSSARSSTTRTSVRVATDAATIDADTS